MEREGRYMPDGTQPGTGPETGAANGTTEVPGSSPEHKAHPPFSSEAEKSRLEELVGGPGETHRPRVGIPETPHSAVPPEIPPELRERAEAIVGRALSDDEIREMVRPQMADEMAGMGPDDPIESGLPSYRRYNEKEYKDKSEAEKTEAQIRWLEGLMTKFETGSAMDLNSYLSSQAQRGNRGLVDKITHLNKGAFYYFQSRMAANKALDLPSSTGGSVDGFLQYGQLLGEMEVQDTLTQRPEVAKAYAELEKRANEHKYIEDKDNEGKVKKDEAGNVKYKFDKAANPAFADVDQLDAIEIDIANGLAEKLVDQQIRDYQAGNEVVPEEKREKWFKEEKEIQRRNVKQAEVLWRVWKRSARQNGLVFKSYEEAVGKGKDKDGNARKGALRRDGKEAIEDKDMTEDQYKKLQEYLLYLPYLERVEHWETIVALADWKDSLSGPVKEDAIQRLTWGGIYHQKNAQGIESIRPGIDYDSQDFFSYLVASGALTDAKNLRPEPGQETAILFSKKTEPIELIDEKGLPTKDMKVTIYERKIPAYGDRPERIERLIVHPNGVVEIDPTSDFDLSRIKLHEVGGKDFYTGKFTAYNLRYAEEMRKNVMNPEKIGRDPFAKPLESLIGLAEHLDSIDKETEKFISKTRNEEHRNPTKDEIDRNLDIKRDEGKIFKEDLFNSLMMGMLEFQTRDLKKYYLGQNINLEEADNTINRLRANHQITDDQAEKAKEITSKLMGYPSNEFLRKLSYSVTMMYYRDKPHEAFLMFLLEILKQGFSDFKG